MLFAMKNGIPAGYLGPVLLTPDWWHPSFCRFTDQTGNIMMASNAIIVCPD